eukprot:1819416-Amphidinium_carterae.1
MHSIAGSPGISQRTVDYVIAGCPGKAPSEELPVLQAIFARFSRRGRLPSLCVACCHWRTPSQWHQDHQT